MRISAESRRGAFRAGYLFGFVIVLAEMFWVTSLVSRWTGSFWLAVIPWILCGFIGAFYFAFLAILIRGCFLRGWFWAIPVVWAGTELVRSYIPGLAFPWFLLASPLSAYPALDQIAFAGTIYFVSAWVCLVNLGIFYLFGRPSTSPGQTEPRGISVDIGPNVPPRPRARTRGTTMASLGERGLMGRRADWFVSHIPHPISPNSRAGITCLCAAALMLVCSIAWYMRPLGGRKVNLTVGQPGIDMAFGDQSRRQEEFPWKVGILVGEAQRAKSQLLVLPEGVAEGGEYPPVAPFALPVDPPVLFGGQRGRDPAYQTAFLYDHGGWSYADKSRLVVFGEYVPGRDYIPFLNDFKLPGGDLQPAKKVAALHFDDLTVGPLLCFEALFYDVAYKQACNGSQVLAVMSIDDWYMGTPAPEQLRDASVWRAIETNLPLLRSASLGYTMIVDQKGRVAASLPLGKCGSLTLPVVIQDKPFHNPVLPLFPWIAGLSPFVLALYFLFGHLRARAKLRRA